MCILKDLYEGSYLHSALQPWASRSWLAAAVFRLCRFPSVPRRRCNRWKSRDWIPFPAFWRKFPRRATTSVSNQTCSLLAALEHCNRILLFCKPRSVEYRKKVGKPRRRNVMAVSALPVSKRVFLAWNSQNNTTVLWYGVDFRHKSSFVCNDIIHSGSRTCFIFTPLYKPDARGGDSL